MIKKKLNTIEGNLSIKIPTHVNELTLGQLMDMQEKPYLNDLDAISILSGVPVNELSNVANINDFQIFNEQVLSLSNQIKHLYESDEIPKRVTFYLDENPLTINVINNLSVEPAGAFMAARDIIADEINEHIKKHGEDDWEQYFKPSLKACCYILAHYFYCRVTGKKYNDYGVDEFVKQVKSLRVTEALPIARHFFHCYPNLYQPKPNFFHRLLRNWRRKQGYRHLKSLNISTPLMP